jgi:hypothetical protein
MLVRGVVKDFNKQKRGEIARRIGTEVFSGIEKDVSQDSKC